MNKKIDKYLGKYGSGFVIKTYSKGDIKTYTLGYKEIKPNKKVMEENDIFDIASLTKTITAIMIYKAYEKNLLSLEDEIYTIDNRFKRLKNVSILDLLSHKVEIWTDGYLGSAKTKEEFENILFSAHIKSKKRAYVDAHYMILSTVLEKIYNKRFDQIIYDNICNPLGIKTMSFEEKKYNNYVSFNYEKRNDKIIIDAYPGIHHDTKARTAYNLGIYLGHAGIFANADDFFKILISLIDKKEKLLKNYTVEIFLKHDNIKKDLEKCFTDLGVLFNIDLKDKSKIIEEIFSSKNKNIYYNKIPRTYNHFGARYKNEISEINEIPNKASDKTIVFTGYTGPFYLIDFEKEIIILVMNNVIHNNDINRFKKLTLLKKFLEDIYNNI